ncbi:MAG TPA: MBL fold metallo-hydrolase [Candidatus Binatia bacterium]|nr:MBL fold metallo-hydrolase [Candidatus Binatia bacterium]
MRRHLAASLVVITLVMNLAAASVSAQSVKITPLGSHEGEFCSGDRAFLFEDPTGVRILYDPGATIAGGTDPRLGEVHAVLLSHGHNDHIGGNKIPEMNSGTCDRPKTVSAAPHSNTAEIAAAKNSALVVIPPMDLFLSKKIQSIRGKEISACAEAGLAREITVPLSAPCRGNLHIGGKRTLKFSGAAQGVQISMVRADHSNYVARQLLSDGGKTTMAADDLSVYMGNAVGYVLVFTNGLRVYLSGDNALSGDMKTIINGFYKANLAVINVVPSSMQPEEAAYAINELIQPLAVIPSHTNEAATKGGRVNPNTRAKQFMELVKGRPVHLPLSGKTMEFDGSAKCVRGCS